MLLRKTRWIRALALTLSLTLVLGLGSILAKKPVKAVDRGFLAYTPDQSDIDKAKKEREEAKEDITRLS